ncbi:MAG TPA: hypothetical protein VFB85_00140, partial [Vicinamibacterales bacterium]|nr:hypothetical protein [Vicinamibacterales bacterium]
LRLFRRVRPPFYVIGLYDDDDLTHELAHALFFMRSDYRREVRAAMHRFNTAAIARHLASLGYHRRVLEDEVHAYLLAESDVPGVSAARLKPLRRSLRSIYRAHAPR